MHYISTRGLAQAFTAARAILQGLAPDGGLLVPEYIPRLSAQDFLAMKALSYQERALKILTLYLDFPVSDLRAALARAYSEEKFGPTTAPLTSLNPYAKREFMLELWHGPTAAFKDIALQLLPELMRLSAEQLGLKEQLCILTATSGDTGKAALEGFRDRDGVSVMTFFPTDGVSRVQKLQMQTQQGHNCHVFAVQGNFDDAQREVKAVFSDSDFGEELKQMGVRLTSANSINWGRLLPQIVYYCSAACDLLSQELLEEGETFDVVVPSGNFGNILAAWYAKQMGAPIGVLHCASNKNHVLTDFLREGKYNAKRAFFKTNTPSMDILVSSNLERLLFEMTGRDATKVTQWMSELSACGCYEVDAATLRAIKAEFQAAFADEAVIVRTIRECYHEYDHVLDPHTAAAFAIRRRRGNRHSEDKTKVVYVATASPFKFAPTVAEALFQKRYSGEDSSPELLQQIADESELLIPESMLNIFTLPLLHEEVIEASAMKDTVRRVFSR